MTIEQVIEWHRVRGQLAAKGAILAMVKGEHEAAQLFLNEAEFHTATVELLETRK